MKGDIHLVECLNKVLFNELTAINQYFLHSSMFNHWGYTQLGEYEYRSSIDEMKHAEKVIKRILFLEGLPNLQQLGRLRIGENVSECLQGDLDLELEALDNLREAVTYSEKISDYVSRELFQYILIDEEEHVDWLETQQGVIRDIGVERYMLSKLPHSLAAAE